MAVCEMCGRSGELVSVDVEGIDLDVCSKCSVHGRVKKKVIEVREWNLRKSHRVEVQFALVGDFSSIIQECINKFSPRIRNVDFVFDNHNAKATAKNLTMVTIAKDSGKHGEVFGYARKTSYGIYHICFFENNINQHIIKNPLVDTKYNIGLVFLHEVIHILDKIKNGKDTLTDEEITELANYYLKNKYLPIMV